MSQRSSSTYVALAGILLAVTTILLYLAVVLPFHTFFFTFLSSFPLALLCYRWNLRIGLFFFLTSSLLTLFLFPSPRLLPYLLFFGHYPLFKIFIEVRGRRYSLFMKSLYFNLFFLMGLTLLRSLFLPFLPSIPTVFFILLIQPIFLFYDYSFTKAMDFFLSHLP